jgi:hypothetical protein
VLHTSLPSSSIHSFYLQYVNHSLLSVFLSACYLQLSSNPFKWYITYEVNTQSLNYITITHHCYNHNYYILCVLGMFSFPQVPLFLYSVFLVSCGGVRLSPLGTSATNWPILPALDDRWWVWSSRWNENWQGKPQYSEKTYSIAALSTTNPMWPELGSNSGRCCGKLAIYHLSYDTAPYIQLLSNILIPSSILMAFFTTLSASLSIQRQKICLTMMNYTKNWDYSTDEESVSKLSDRMPGLKQEWWPFKLTLPSCRPVRK